MWVAAAWTSCTVAPVVCVFRTHLASVPEVSSWAAGAAGATPSAGRGAQCAANGGVWGDLGGQPACL